MGYLKPAAVVAAAGRSRRMGTPKQLLDWDGRPAIAAAVAHVRQAGCDPVACVVGHRFRAVAAAVRAAGGRAVLNRNYRRGALLQSFQVGLAALSRSGAPGALFALGDQPHVPVRLISQVVRSAQATPSSIVFPSAGGRRGHPFYLPTALWDEVLALSPPATMRDFLARHERGIAYVLLDDDAVLYDVDTPADYRALRARYGEEGG